MSTGLFSGSSSVFFSLVPGVENLGDVTRTAELLNYLLH